MSAVKHTYHKFKSSVVVHFGEKTVTIHKDDPRYQKVLDAIESNRLEELPSLADNEAMEEIKFLLKLGK
jgi:hypothetical protein